MARFCFYCNRELAAGESCQCRLKAREDLRRESARRQPSGASAETDGARPAGTYGGQARGAGGTARKRSPLVWSELRPVAADFVKPLDQLELAAPHAPSAIFWISASILMQGGFVAALTRQPAMFFVGVLFGLVSLLLLAILLFIRTRVRARRSFKVSTLFTRSRPVYLYGTVIYLLAAISGLGNPLFGSFLFLFGDLAVKAGLLWQIRQNTPLDRNNFFLTAVLTIVLHTLFQSILIQSFLSSLFAGF